MRRVAVIGGRSPLGRLVARVLETTPEVERVSRIESRGDPEHGLEVVAFTPDHRPLVEYLAKADIDTVIQCGLVADRNGESTSPLDPDVIGTMCLGAAVGHDASHVRNWVVTSSSDVYPIRSLSPLVQHEDQPVPRKDGSRSAAIVEAEDYARDLALRLPHVNVAILRLQQLAGERVGGPLSALLGRPRIPVPIGFDATIQLLHIEDAARALAFAGLAELAGIYNAASAGTIHWSEAVRQTGRPGFPVVPFTWSLIEPLLVFAGIPHVPTNLVDLLHFGHALDTQKLERAGWKPIHDQRSCLGALSIDA